MSDTTHIRVSRRSWKALNRLKEPGDDFDDVVWQLTQNQISSPGIYLVNATGEAFPLATESGDGDTKLLKEALDEHDAKYKIEVENDA